MSFDEFDLTSYHHGFQFDVDTLFNFTYVHSFFPFIVLLYSSARCTARGIVTNDIFQNSFVYIIIRNHPKVCTPTRHICFLISSIWPDDYFCVIRTFSSHFL